MENSQTLFKSEKISRISLPPGTLLAAPKWENTHLISIIKKLCPVTYFDGSEIEDFRPSVEASVLFLTEAELLTDSNYKRELVRFRKAQSTLRKIVVVQRTLLTAGKFKDIQEFVSIELGLLVIAVNSIEEAAKLLHQMVICESKKLKNPFSTIPKTSNPPDEIILNILQCVPRLGVKKALIILDKFKSLQNVGNATEAEFAEVVGNAAAEDIHRFFHSSVT